jgi:hypothetical protein
MAAEMVRLALVAPPERLPEPAESVSDERVRIDALDLVDQLGSTDLKESLRHLYAANGRWTALLAERNHIAAATTYEFIEREMPDALFMMDQFRVIESKRNMMYELGGHVLDLGVYKGSSTRALARIFPEETIHGFDSFEGLPDDWSYTLKGAFGDVDGLLPHMPNNVALHKGWFEDTVPAWTEANDERPISVLRIDCDIYSSTKTVLDVLAPRLQAGSWIVFDELIGYMGWEQHEYKAFSEFIETSKLDYTYIAYGLTYTIVRLG